MSLQAKYRNEIAAQLMQELGLSNVHQIPKITKIVVNAGIGSYLAGSRDTAPVEEDMAAITGQKPVVRKARMSVSNFKLREGMPNGVFVTLRGARMYSFLERLINIVLPRIRDFRGYSVRSFDGRGNYSLGIKDHLIFPEIATDKIIKPFGLQVTITTNTNNDDHSKALLEKFGFPFSKTK